MSAKVLQNSTRILRTQTTQTEAFLQTLKIQGRAMSQGDGGDEPEKDSNCKSTQTPENPKSREHFPVKKNGNPKVKVLKEVGLFAAKTAVISGVVLGGVAIAVPALGFTSAGVAVGSLAALYQSTFLGGTIVSGSAFAVLQSVGAAGLAASTQAGIVGVSAMASGVHTAARKIFKRK